MTSASSQLMIRVESLSGPVPVEAFLRIAGELSSVAAEVGRHLAGEEAQAGAPLTGSQMDGGTNSGGIARGWRIADMQIDAPTENGTSDGRRHHAAALIVVPPKAHKGAPQRVREGVREIAERCEERPVGFSDASLRSLRRVGQSVGRQLRVTLSAGQGKGEAIALDDTLAHHIDGWLNGQIASMGSVEGKLEIISIHNRPRFTIYGREGLRVECLFPEAMLPQVKSALGERVCLRGQIRYRRDGKPATVEVQLLKVQRLALQIPSLERLCDAVQVASL